MQRNERLGEPHEQGKQRWWRAPLVGYLLAFPLVGAALLIPFLEAAWGIDNRFIGAANFIVMAIIGLVWGVGPALFSIVLSVLALDYFIVPPIGSFSLHNWTSAISFVPFIFAQLFVLFLIVLRERDRQHLLLAEQVARERAQELATNNQALAESNTKLAQMDQLKDQFLSRASHELKTPIATIRGHVQIALRALSKEKNLPQGLTFLPAQLEKVEAQTQRLHALVDDLLDLSSLQTGGIPLRIAPCDLGRLCREVVEEQITLTGRHVALEIAASPLVIQIDNDKISQVLINLLTNAIKYSPEDAVIQMSVNREQNDILLQIHNTGSLIPLEQQEHIFEPFYRAPNALSSSKQGWGLGLAISKEIIKRHGGQMWVESAAGKGTTFFVSLPILDDHTHNNI